MTDEFLRKFRFDPTKHLFVGVERECFFVENGSIAPRGPAIIPHLLSDDNAYGYELSACQLELRTAPSALDDLGEVLLTMGRRLRDDQLRLRFSVVHQEVAPFDMPLDIYPDPTGRYQKITKDMPVDKLRAACRVAGTHVHIGMGSAELAIKAYNAAIGHLDELCALGDHSEGERLAIYKVVAPRFAPPRFEDWAAYEHYARENGFWERPRDCWHIIRLSAHGTIEFRMFGATPDPMEIVKWASRCHDICKHATA